MLSVIILSEAMTITVGRGVTTQTQRHTRKRRGCKINIDWYEKEGRETERVSKRERGLVKLCDGTVLLS